MTYTYYGVCKAASFGPHGWYNWIPAVLFLGIAATPTLGQSKIPQRILWCGNSLTTTNNLPGIMDTLTSTSDNSLIVTTSLVSAEGGAAFQQHATPIDEYGTASTSLRTLQVIAQNGPWDYVTLQDQSGSYFNLAPPHFSQYGAYRSVNGSIVNDLYTTDLTDAIFNAGAIPVFFMTWRQSGAPMSAASQAEVAYAYSYAAAYEQAMCSPFGNAMLLNYLTYGNSTYTDDVHPSLMTQYTNACVMYATLTDSSPVGLNDADTGVGSSFNLTLLQENAWTAYTQYRDTYLASCNHTMCIRFLNRPNGTLNPIPTPEPTTTAEPVTIFVPPTPRCNITGNASEILLDPDSTILNPTTFASIVRNG